MFKSENILCQDEENKNERQRTRTKKLSKAIFEGGGALLPWDLEKG